MSTYIGLIGTTYEVGDRRWLLASPKVKLNGTLDISKFNQTGTSAVQTVTVNGGPTGGTFTLTYAGQTTAALPYNATAAAVQAALQALPNIGTGYEGLAPVGSSGYVQYPGAVSVTLSGSAYTITFQGALASVKVAVLTATASLTGGTTPGVTVANTTAGVTAHYPNGFIPSGCAVGLVTATGLYGPYDSTASDGRQVCKGLTYADVRAVWLAGATSQIADKVGTGLVVYDAMVSQTHLPFQGGPGSIDSAAITALANISWQA